MDVSWSEGIAACPPLQRRLWLKGTENHPCARRQQALLAEQQSMVAVRVNLCRWAKTEPFNDGLPQAALPYPGQPKLAVFVEPFLLALSSFGTVFFQR